MREQMKLMPLGKAFEEETGHRPHPTTLWRFYTAGSKGIRLETWMVGGRRMTHRTAVRAFIEGTSKQTENVSSALSKELG